MTLIEVVGLGLVQGLTEFLPVSSSGHLIAARMIFGWSDVDGTLFDTVLHLGTLGAVLVYYWKTWWSLFFGERSLLAKIIGATVPAAIAGWLFEDVIAVWLRSEGVLIVSFLITALVLWWFDRKDRESERAELSQLRWREALVIGMAQAVALVPAISRSGMTIAAGRAQGLTRQAAVKFSFLLSAPIIAGASGKALLELAGKAQFEPSVLTMGLVSSFASGLLAIYLLIKYVERVSFRPFAVYLVALAVILFFVS